MAAGIGLEHLQSGKVLVAKLATNGAPEVADYRCSPVPLLVADPAALAAEDGGGAARFGQSVDADPAEIGDRVRRRDRRESNRSSLVSGGGCRAKCQGGDERLHPL